MADRIVDGYKLYKDDAVVVEHYEPSHIIFKVKNHIWSKKPRKNRAFCHGFVAKNCFMGHVSRQSIYSYRFTTERCGLLFLPCGLKILLCGL